MSFSPFFSVLFLSLQQAAARIGSRHAGCKQHRRKHQNYHGGREENAGTGGWTQEQTKK